MVVEKEEIIIDLGLNNRLQILEKLKKFTGNNRLKFEIHGVGRIGISIKSNFRLNIRTSIDILGNFGTNFRIGLKSNWGQNEVMNRLIQVLAILVEYAQDVICKNEAIQYK